MDFGTIVGFIFGTIAIFGVACKWEIMSYYDTPSLGLVFGGCITTILLSVPLDKIKKMPATFLLAFKTEKVDLEACIKRLVELSEIARKEGILALENVLEQLPDPYFRQGLQLAVDGTDPEVITSVLNLKLENIERRHEENRLGWELCRGAAPSWGAMGTVIGLVQMVKGGVEDPNALVRGIAVALLTTFYGSLISTWLIGPICDRLAGRSADEVLQKNLVLQGIMSIQAGEPPRLTEQKLRMFLGGWKSDKAE